MTRTRRIHPAWFVAATAFVALIGSAGFRAAPGALFVPLHHEFGWSTSVMSAAVSINLVLSGLTAPFAAALMDRFGIRQVTSTALMFIALGSGLTVFMTEWWQLLLTWGLLIGLGTTTACRRPRRPACSPSSGSSTSSARSVPATSPTASTRATCWWATTRSEASD